MSVASGVRRGLLGAALLVGACAGCASPVRYVQKYPDGGVIAMPTETPANMAKAEAMMHAHLPQGYVVEPLQMVPVGAPYRTVAQVGYFREARWHQDHQILLTYHVRLPVGQGPPGLAPPPVAGAAAPRPAPPQAASPPGLPPEPMPIGN